MIREKILPLIKNDSSRKRGFQKTVFLLSIHYLISFLSFIWRQRGNALANNNTPAIMIFAVLSLFGAIVALQRNNQ